MELAAKQDRDFEILSVIAPGLQGEKTVQDFPKWYQEQGYKDIPVLYDTQAIIKMLAFDRNSKIKSRSLTASKELV
ncbi:thioredoxin [Streptococcus sp. GMD4S]|nr:thioredoxin [Streptococcus sp. GMD4S]